MSNEEILKELKKIYSKLHKLYGRPFEILDTCDFNDLPDALQELDREIEDLDDALETLIDEIENR